MVVDSGNRGEMLVDVDGAVDKTRTKVSSSLCTRGKGCATKRVGGEITFQSRETDGG